MIFTINFVVKSDLDLKHNSCLFIKSIFAKLLILQTVKQDQDVGNAGESSHCPSIIPV